jgi:L-aspartate oxidase
LLLTENGDRFVEELAPRDVVARAIKARGSVRLDLREIDRSRFPALMQNLVDAGFHPDSEPVPVSPAAHYTMGGVVTDLHGATDVPGLYVAGESACTGVHGANRLASNSMLECLVFGRRAALTALAQPLAGTPSGDSRWTGPGTDEAPVTPELREALWENAGLIRDAGGLESLTSSPHLLASLVARSALARHESRGGHFRVDFPTEDAALDGRHTVLRPGREPELESWS